jgi:acetyltransferase
VSFSSLRTLFEPQRVAVVDSGDGDHSVGETVLRNVVGAGFEGVVYPVSPGREAVEGVPAYDSLDALPARPDLAVLCSRKERVVDDVRACSLAGVPGVVVLASGFRAAGGAGAALARELQAEAARHRSLRLLRHAARAPPRRRPLHRDERPDLILSNARQFFADT